MTDLTQAERRTLDLLLRGDRSGSRSENGNTVLGTVAPERQPIHLPALVA